LNGILACAPATVTVLHFDASFLGCTTIARASHVEPCESGWSADMSPVGGPVLTGFTKRSQALAAEVAWLEENVL